uniref:Serpin domain-containing protein n=1 Tax=Panagrolaimus superbus TaxID=310955 RepID=A0A914Y9X0_9BILA
MIDVPKAKAAKEKVAKKICETINNYVNEKTDGKIRDIIKVEELYSAMNILISSGICIVGKWEQPFNDPVFSTFYSSATSKKTIQMLSKSISPGGCNLTKGNSWKCIGLPYKTRNIWLHILLPNEKDGLSHILENLNYSFIKRCVRRYYF